MNREQKKTAFLSFQKERELNRRLRAEIKRLEEDLDYERKENMHLRLDLSKVTAQEKPQADLAAFLEWWAKRP